MKYVWIILCLAIAGGAGYYYYDSAGKPKTPLSHELHEAKGILLSKTRDHEALWVHYSYKDAAGDSHEMSEKVPYIDFWEKLKIGQKIDILYNDDGLSVLKAVAQHQVQTEQK